MKRGAQDADGPQDMVIAFRTDGDAFAGKCKMGMFGSAKVSGSRA